MNEFKIFHSRIRTAAAASRSWPQDCDRPEPHVKGSHFTVQELAALWGLGVDKIRELFENEPDLIKLKNPPKKGQRAYVTLRIPEAVAARVQRRNS